MPTRLPLLLLLVAASAPAQDAILMPDGFSIRGGKSGKEAISMPQMEGMFTDSTPFDYLNCGSKFVFFPKNSKKGFDVVKGVPEDKLLEFRRPAVPGQSKMPGAMDGYQLSASPFNADGRQTITLKNPGYPADEIKMVTSHVNPRFVYLTSVTHQLRQVYSSAEVGPAGVRHLLANHPDLKDGWLPVPDPAKRLKIAEFMLAAGWRAEARAELAKAKQDVPWAWPKEAADQHDQLAADIDKADVRWVVDELKVALAAGHYKLAESVLKTYQPKGAGAEDLKALADLKARIEEAQPRYEAARKHLRRLIDELTGADKRVVAAAVVGGPAVVGPPLKPLTADQQALVAGAEAVFAELHPDTLDRVKTFTQKAVFAEKELAAGRTPKTAPATELAYAVSGWVKGGEAGETEKPDLAARQWNTRVMLVNYLGEQALNDRVLMLKRYQQSSDKLDPDEVAQIVTYLPPIAPVDLSDSKWVKKVEAKAAGVPDVYKVESGPLPDDRDGVTYFLRLPREYHPGRPYPVVVALNDPGVDTPRMIGLLAAEADRHGYILVAPEWAPPFSGKRFDYSGKDHRLVTSTIRDVSRKFSADQDRVFAYGFREGGTFALDLAMSRPDFFAGVVSMGATPVARFYDGYTRNAQKLALYSVTGELAQQSVMELRKLYQNWLPFGYYALLVVHKGRGADWFESEVPTTFDWMNRKKRVRGLGSLRMDGKRFDSWATFRPTDDRFYWVGVSELMKGNTLSKPEFPTNPPNPATFSADVINGNTVLVKTNLGVKKVTIWLEKGMVDWQKEVKFNIDNQTGLVRPTKVTPDLGLMLEELYRTGDRKMLFFAKFEFKL